MTDKEEITDRLGMLSDGALDRLRKYFNDYDPTELPATKQPAQDSDKDKPQDAQKPKPHQVSPRITPSLRQ